MPRYNDVVINQAGHPVPGVTVAVYDGSTQNLSSLYSDEALTQGIANPLTTDGLGRIQFSVASGDYTLALSGGTPPITSQSYLVTVGSSGSTGSQSVLQPLTGVQNGSNLVFTVAVAPVNTLAVQVYLNGQLLGPADYTLVGTTFTFTVAPNSGDLLQVYF